MSRFGNQPPSSRSRLFTREPAGPLTPFGDLTLTALPALQNTTHSVFPKQGTLRSGPSAPAAPGDPPPVTGRPCRRHHPTTVSGPAVSPPTGGVGPLPRQHLRVLRGNCGPNPGSRLVPVATVARRRGFSFPESLAIESNGATSANNTLLYS